MSNRQVEYCRADNGIDLADTNIDEDTITYRRRRNGMSKTEKLLLACVMVLVFLSAIFAGLYFSERQHRRMKKEGSASDGKGDGKCEGPDEKVNKRNQTMEICGSNRGNATCTNDSVVLQAAQGRVIIDNFLVPVLIQIDYRISCIAQ